MPDSGPVATVFATARRLIHECDGLSPRSKWVTLALLIEAVAAQEGSTPQAVLAEITKYLDIWKHDQDVG